MSEKEKLCYLAGLLDGEGSFFVMSSVNGRLQRYSLPYMALGQNDVRMLDWVKQNYGGYIQYQRARPDKNRNAYHIWKLVGKKAIALTKLVYPYLTVKQNKARCVIDFQYPARRRKRSKNDPTLLAEKAEIARRRAARTMPSPSIAL